MEKPEYPWTAQPHPRVRAAVTALVRAMSTMTLRREDVRLADKEIRRALIAEGVRPGDASVSIICDHRWPYGKRASLAFEVTAPVKRGAFAVTAVAGQQDSEVILARVAAGWNHGADAEGAEPMRLVIYGHWVGRRSLSKPTSAAGLEADLPDLICGFLAAIVQVAGRSVPSEDAA